MTPKQQIIHTDILPDGYNTWTDFYNDILKSIPKLNPMYKVFYSKDGKVYAYELDHILNKVKAGK